MTDIIQSLWIGDSLSIIERLAVTSFIHNKHEFHLYTYDDVAGVPDRVVIRDANELVPRSKIFTYKGSYALFADLFRWKLLFERGGYWVDMDQICLRTFDFTEELVFGRESFDLIAIGVLRFPARHEIADAMLNSCLQPNKPTCFDGPKQIRRKRRRRWLRKGYESFKWGDIGGPLAFTRALTHFGLVEHAKPYTTFYPIAHSNWDAIFDETFKGNCNLFSNTYAVHLWNEMMRRKTGFNKNNKFPENSLIEHLKRRYLEDE